MDTPNFKVHAHPIKLCNNMPMTSVSAMARAGAAPFPLADIERHAGVRSPVLIDVKLHHLARK